MADSLLPWISEYLLGVAETHGADLSRLPLVSKKRKVQLTEFLTFGREGVESAVWGKVSDKQLELPIRFNKEAVADYQRLSNERITHFKTALISIKDFKVFFARIPMGGQSNRMSAQPHLAIECGFFAVIGSLGEAKFGNPRDVEVDNDLRLWSDGLKRDGGAGNILKERKLERDKLDKNNEKAVHNENVVEEGRPKSVVQKTRPKKNVNTSHERTTNAMSSKPADPIKDYENIWRNVTKNLSFRHPPEDVIALLQDMPITGETPSGHSSPQSQRPPRKRRRTGPFPHALDLSSQPDADNALEDHCSVLSSPERPLTDWSFSPGASQRHMPSFSDTDVDIPVQVEADTLLDTHQVSTDRSSHPTAPPPGQRVKVVIDLTTPAPTSSFPSFPDTVLSPTAAHDPLSSQTHMSSPAPLSESLIMISSPVPNCVPRSVTRKVPRPAQPAPAISSAGHARILAPNSDTSGNASQSFFVSQSQSQALESSQPVVLSQLEKLQTHQEDAEDDEERDDHNSLFSASQENLTYDGDTSCPTDGIKDGVLVDDQCDHQSANNQREAVIAHDAEAWAAPSFKRGVKRQRTSDGPGSAEGKKRRTGEAVGRKLGGYSMEKVVAAGSDGRRWMSWGGLEGILLRTGRDRAKQRS